MKAQHQSQTTLITIEDATAALTKHAEQQFAAQTEANKMKGANYLAENAKKEGVVVTKSGLQYTVINQGDGPKPTATDQVTVHYRGTLIDGTEFDSSYARGEPATFGLNQVIPGWTEGVQLMNVGSKYQFVVPYELAYGERGAGGAIGPFETLIFEVELIEIKS
jgi:FKBP-type peptidyl-prolyl cis-trans isomerase